MTKELFARVVRIQKMDSDTFGQIIDESGQNNDSEWSQKIFENHLDLNSSNWFTTVGKGTKKVSIICVGVGF